MQLFARLKPIVSSRRTLATIGDFERRAAAYWTIDRAAWLSANADAQPLSPDKPGVARLLRVLGILNPDASMSPDKLRKYHQINAMCHAIDHALAAHVRGADCDEPLRLVDLCTGSASHLALLLCFSARRRWQRPVHVIAVDADATRVEAAKQRARLLGFGPDVLHHRLGTVRELPPWHALYPTAFAAAATSAPPPPPHGVFALHACDTATDEALAFGIEAEAEALLVAPCCQAELCVA